MTPVLAFVPIGAFVAIPLLLHRGPAAVTPGAARGL